MNIEKLQELERLTSAASGDDPPLGAMTAFFNAMEPATVAELIVVAAAQPAPPVDVAGERAAFEAWAAPQKFDLTCPHMTYANTVTDYSWLGWQARAALAAQRQADAPASATGSIDTPEFRELAYAYAKAVCLKTIPAQDKARVSLIAHIDDQVATAYDTGRQAGMSGRVALSADGNSVFIDGEGDVALARAAAPTDVSARLREYAGNPGYSHNDYADTMRAGADEIERYHGAMLAWKQAAETRDRQLSDERCARQNDRVAARAAPAVGALTDAQINAIIRNVAELPDRDSPADQPEMMLVSADELHGLLAAAIAPAAMQHHPAAQQVGACPACQGNDGDAPCAYPSGKMPGCLRDERLQAGAALDRPAGTRQEPIGYAPAYLLDHLEAGEPAVMLTVTAKPLPALGARIALYAAPQPSAPAAPSFQSRVQQWMMACFGPMIAGDREERSHRFLEESLELVQSCGCTADEAHQLVDYVFGRPVGEPAQEVGGAMVTLAALCLANGLDMHDAAEVELARIWTKVEAIRAKQAAKPKYGPLPGMGPAPHRKETRDGRSE